jgi:inorganic pyrophosphatase
MPDLGRLEARCPGGFHVVVETPRGAAVKLKYDLALGAFKWSRPLAAGLCYPFDWGFVPSTRAPDGDPLDAMVLGDSPTWPGVVIPCRPVAVLEVEQNRKDRPGRQRNDRLLMVPLRAPRWEAVRDLEDVPPRTRAELERFFEQATLFLGKDLTMLGWRDAQAAQRQLEASSRVAPRRKRQPRSGR